MTTESTSLLQYLNDYVSKLKLASNSPKDMAHSAEGLLQTITAHHITQGDFFIAVRNIISALKSLHDDNEAENLHNLLLISVQKEQAALVELLRIEQGISFYPMNKGDKDMRYYFYSHIPEKISLTELKDRINTVNSKLNMHFPHPSYNSNEILFGDLSDEHKQALCMFSQFQTMNRVNSAKTPEQIDEFKKELTHRKKVIEELNVSVDMQAKKLEELEKKSVPQDELIATRLKLKESRTKYDNLVAAYEQDIHLIDSYQAHFLRESRWRIINAFNHIVDGKLYWFGEPAEKSWIYIITDDGDFVFGNRQFSLKGGFYERLPHATLAKGRKVIASGEIWFENGEVRKYNAYSGHYADLNSPKTWEEQVMKVLPTFGEKFGLKGDYVFASGEFPNN